MLEHQDRYRLFGYRIPQYFWFLISGAFCDIIQALLDYLVSILYLSDWERPTVCWTIGYTLSIIVRHTSHRLLVFGDYEGSYCYSLGRTYLTYSVSIILSMISNHYFISLFHLSHRDAWIITMLWTGILNYFLLKASWKNKHEKYEEVEKEGEINLTSSSSSSSNKGGKKQRGEVEEGFVKMATV